MIRSWLDAGCPAVRRSGISGCTARMLIRNASEREKASELSPSGRRVKLAPSHVGPPYSYTAHTSHSAHDPPHLYPVRTVHTVHKPCRPHTDRLCAPWPTGRSENGISRKHLRSARRESGARRSAVGAVNNSAQSATASSIRAQVQRRALNGISRRRMASRSTPSSRRAGRRC
jgi:hypothetical protein